MADQAPLAFFSYSRNDSEFVLKLAKDLRTGGAVVWLDQLDIRPGQRWDNAVERALVDCAHLLVVLSPASVESTNVMDEVSFALEEKKLVIPVLYRDCNIPFRLRRLQYIDTRVRYEEGIARLLIMLGARQQVEPPPVTVPSQEERQNRRTVVYATTKETTDQQPKVDQSVETEPAGAEKVKREPSSVVVEAVPGSSRSKYLIAMVAILVVVLGLWAALSRTSGKNTNDPVYQACVFDPVSNVRVEPNAESAIACSVDTVRNIEVNATPIRAKNGIWWQTKVCGRTGYIANNQVHVMTPCTH